MQDDRDLGQETASEGRFGYASRHLMIALDPARESHPDVRAPARARSRRCRCARCCSTRGRSSSTTSATRARCRPSTRASSTAASRSPPGCSSWPTGSSPRSATGCAASRPRCAPSRDDDPRIDPRELAAFLAGQYSDAGWSRTEHYGWISGLLLELGITSLDELGDVLRRADEAAITERMDYRYPPGAVRRLDDALLCGLRRALRRPARQRAPARRRSRVAAGQAALPDAEPAPVAEGLPSPERPRRTMPVVGPTG